MKQYRTKSFLFLLELCIAILFLSITSAACIQMYAKAKQLNKTAEELSVAVNLCENIGAQVKAEDSVHTLAHAVCGNIVEEGKITILYNKNWEITSESPYYATTIQIHTTDDITTAQIAVCRVSATSSPPIYTLEVSNYL